MERRKFTREFKLEAVRLIKDRGVSYVQASQDLNVHPSQLRDWVKKLSEDPQHAFPGHGQMKPEQLEIVRLKREVAKLKAERDILKKAAAYFAKESPPTGGSHGKLHRTPKILSHARRRGRRVATRCAGAAAGDAGDWLAQSSVAQRSPALA